MVFEGVLLLLVKGSGGRLADSVDPDTHEV
jgi:hypothetical protein